MLCVDRCAVPATLLSYVLGLPKDWLSRLPGSIQWYVSVWLEQPQGAATVRVIAGPYGIFLARVQMQRLYFLLLFTSLY